MSSSSVRPSPEPPDLSDIRADDWVGRWLPRRVAPYARLCRLDRPVGTWLTVLPCWAALVQAAGGWPDLWRLLVFSLGALLMRGIGCTINDIADRNFDGRVERTRFRPLASGQLTLRQALWFLAAQVAVCALLLLAINPYSRWLAVALMPIVAIYPFCKRYTHWPQVVLGIGFNWGMLMAWSDTVGAVPAGAVLMWAGAVLWQVGYDTLYAYADVRDDRTLGLKSTAIRFGDHGRRWIAGFYAATVLAWAGGGVLLGLSWGYHAVLALVALHLAWQAWRFDVAQPARSFQMFRDNMRVGALLVLAALAGTLTA